MKEQRGITLIKLAQVDFPLCAQLFFNETVMNMNLGRTFTDKEAEQFFQLILKVNDAAADGGYFKVVREDDLSFLGIAGLVLDSDEKNAELEYLLLPEYWGQGYASAAVELLLNMARTVSGMEEVTAITDPENVRSVRLLKKFGFASKGISTAPDGSQMEEFQLNLHCGGVLLTPAQPGDREAVNVLALQVHALHVDWQPQFYAHTDCLYDEPRFQEALDEDCLYVARLEGKVVGYVRIPIAEISHPGLVHSKTMKLEEICVAAEHRHSGIGRKMMQDVQSIAKQKGCTDIRLTCAPQNVAAIALYESFGMEVKCIQYSLKL